MRPFALAAVALVLIGASVGSSGAESVAGSASAAVASVNLSRGNRYDALAAVNGRLIVSGLTVGPGASPVCSSAVVNPVTLVLSQARSGNCDDPTLAGKRPLPIITVEPQVNWCPPGNCSGIATETVRISRVTSAAPGYRLGPVVMTFPQISDTYAEWVYGGGYLWLFDQATKRGSQLLRISTTTGAVLQTIPMPDIDRPLIAADADGLWLTPAGNSSGRGLYHVAPGMARPELVFASTGYGAMWIVASGHSVWLDVAQTTPQQATLLRFAGTKLALRVPSGPSGLAGEFGYGQPKFVGGASGIWTVQHQEIFRIDPMTAHASDLVRIPGACGQPTPVIINRFLFVLESPRTLYRVTLR